MSKDVVDRVLNDLGINKELALEFLVVFSRFEYALKMTGFAEGDRLSTTAAWDDYAWHSSKLLSDEIKDKLKEDVSYLCLNPPKKLVRNGDDLVWMPTYDGRAECEMVCLLRMVRRVRENLFHGRKDYPNDAEQPGRDDKRLQSCLQIIYSCIENDFKLSKHF